MDVTDLATGVGSALAGAASSAFSQAQQYRYQKRWALRGPGYQMQGLRDAGLNPILAAGSIGGGAGGGQVSPISPPDVAGGVSSALQARYLASQSKFADAQTQTETTKQNLNSAAATREAWQAESARVDAYLKRIQAEFLGADGANTRRNLWAIGKSMSDAGLRPDAMLHSFGSSASSILRTLRNAK